ncbi:MAG: FAD-dependent oxidoreductase [Nitrososphaeraceae archaeon]|nr:FAD-dependent oxidoreductase [Nitrososphaeraceae archaeon]
MTKIEQEQLHKIRIDFSLKREVFFVVIGAIIGAITFAIPETVFEVQMGLPYYLSWIVFGHILGVYSSTSAAVVIAGGITLHILTAISIGIVIGIFLYKTGILNISKLSNGLIYGLLAGFAVFIIFFIPIQQFILAPEMVRTMVEMNPSMIQSEADRQISNNLLTIMVGSIVTHLVFGITVGMISSLLSTRFGSRYRCAIHDISFSRIDSYQKHIELVHGVKPIQQKRILILGGGFGGVEVLRRLQKAFQNDVRIDITLVSKDNFFLFTPMLPEVSSGMIETRHIVTPIRIFCKRAKFYEANVESIGLKNNSDNKNDDNDRGEVIITYAIRNRVNSATDLRSQSLKYDYLVLSLGGKTNFFGMTEVEKNAFTIKNLGDAIILRNHIISMLERADIEHDNPDLRKSFMTFVVVGGGFSGVETVGELNHFVKDSIKDFYHNVDEHKEDLRIILVSSGGRILPEVSEDLGKFALQKLSESGVEVMLNTRLTAASADSIKLNGDDNNNVVIPTHTLIWAGGITTNPLIANLPCDHDKGGRIIVNNYLQVQRYPDVFALGDCACITDRNTGKPYPPTAQHAIREGKVVAENLISTIKHSGKRKQEERRGGRRRKRGDAETITAESISDKNKNSNMISFDYKTKGVMAEIGKRTGVGELLGFKVHGFIAWWIWRSYYLGNLPTIEKKLRVMVDWTLDLLFKRDVTRLKTFAEEEKEEDEESSLKATTSINSTQESMR